ncbi:hypothetical protein BD65_734 [Yersinia ruckeri]|nr:hypothetical protein BD65_734 [Yersinia ruckeri]
MSLIDTKIRSIKPSDNKPFKVSDSRGLYLLNTCGGLRPEQFENQNLA